MFPPRLAVAALPRRTFLGILAQITLFAALIGASGCAAYGPARKGEKIYRNVAFAAPQGKVLRMDLYVPPTARPAPVVLWIFGGSWKFGSKGYHLSLRELTRSGIAVAAIEYRLSGTAKYPAQLEDCQAAVQWLRANGPRFGLDPRRIGASGESAGGHLAALLGTIEGADQIRAVCALYPPTDLVALGRQYANARRPSAIEQLLGGRIEDRLALAALGSPVNHVSAAASPFLIFHGERDELVPLAQSQLLDRRLKRAGVASQLVVVPQKGHWFLLDAAQVATSARFFERHLAEPR